MLKFANPEKGVLILGITQANVDELLAGNPLKVPRGDVAALGLPSVEVFLYVGSTQHALIDQLHQGGLIDEDTAAQLHDHTTDLEARAGRPA